MLRVITVCTCKLGEYMDAVFKIWIANDRFSVGGEKENERKKVFFKNYIKIKGYIERKRHTMSLARR